MTDGPPSPAALCESARTVSQCRRFGRRMAAWRRIMRNMLASHVAKPVKCGRLSPCAVGECVRSPLARPEEMRADARGIEQPGCRLVGATGDGGLTWAWPRHAATPHRRDP